MTVLGRIAEHAGRPPSELSRRDVARWLVTVPGALDVLPRLRRESVAAGRPLSAAFWDSAQDLLVRIATRSATRGEVARWLEATGGEPTAMIGMHVWGDEDERRPLAARLYGELVAHLEGLVRRGEVDPDRLLAGDRDALAGYVAEQERWLGEPFDATTSRMTALFDEADEELFAAWDDADAAALAQLEEVLDEVGARPLPAAALHAAVTRVRASSAGSRRPYDLLASCAGAGSRGLPQSAEELWLALAAGIVSPVDEPPPSYPPEALSSWYALEHADWLAAVGELARRGPGAPAGSGALAGYLASTDLVDGELDPDDLALVVSGFDPVVELWTAIGAVDDAHQLTRLGWWGLPEALRRAWSPAPR